MYLDRKTLIVVGLLVLVIAGGIAFLSLNPSAKNAHQELLQQSATEQ